MDISTGLGLLAGAIVLCTLILLGGDLRMFLDLHAFIVIFGGSFSATLIRFPLNSIFHGLPLGAKFAFTLRRMSQRDLVDEIAGLAEIARKSGPVGLEKVEIDDPFLAKGIRFVADGYDGKIWILNRDDGKEVGSIGRKGHQAGQLDFVERMALDSKGNLYVTEVGPPNTRIQKFVPIK